MKGDYLSPFQSPVIDLYTDIVLFSLKRTVLLELTYPCEENMKNWHSKN